MCQTKKKCARKGRGCAKRKKNVPGRVEEGPKWKKMDIFEIRKGRGGGDGYFWRLQTDGIDSNGRKPYIPRRTWLIIQKEGVQNKKRMCQKWRLKTDDGRKMKDLEQLLGTQQQEVPVPVCTNNNNNI